MMREMVGMASLQATCKPRPWFCWAEVPISYVRWVYPDFRHLQRLRSGWPVVEFEDDPRTDQFLRTLASKQIYRLKTSQEAWRPKGPRRHRHIICLRPDGYNFLRFYSHPPHITHHTTRSIPWSPMQFHEKSQCIISNHIQWTNNRSK